MRAREFLNETRIIDPQASKVYYKPDRYALASQLVAKHVPGEKVDPLINTLSDKHNVKDTDFEWEPASYRVTETDAEADPKLFLKKYIPWIAKELELKDLPKIVFLDQPNDTTFGTYNPNEKTISLVVGSRHPVDIMRTLAHELVHYKQDTEGRLKDGAGETGTPEENEANSEAGVIMRNFNQENPEHLKQ